MKWFEIIKEMYPLIGDTEKTIFRIISFDSLLQMINEKKNTLVSISQWEDVYENFLLKENYVFKGSAYPISDLSNLFFGQCWTTKPSSDAMWRIYSPDKKSVRIKTTIRRLWDSVHLDGEKGRFAIGKVKYFPQSKIESDLISSSPYSIDALGDLIVASLFIKRSNFSHESEYRLIYVCERDSKDIGKKIKEVPINPLDFIMNVYFDPRADQAYIDRCTMILTKAFGYPKSRILKSKLYDFKPCMIEVK